MKMKRKQHMRLRPIPRRPAFNLDCRNEQSSNLKVYNPLMDQNLRSYFEIGQVQKRLVRAGLVQNDGTIVVRARYQRGYRKKKCVGFRMRWSRIATVGTQKRKRKVTKKMHSSGQNHLRRSKLPQIKRKRPSNNPYKAMQKKGQPRVSKEKFQGELNEYKQKVRQSRKSSKQLNQQRSSDVPQTDGFQVQDVQQEEEENIISKDPNERKDQEQAATKIQAMYKGKVARKKVEEKKQEIKEQNEAATKIQAMRKGQLARREVEKKKQQKETKKETPKPKEMTEDEAATKIQARFKGGQERKAMKEKKDKQEKQEQEDAATYIQSRYKGNMARKQVKQKQLEKEENEAATKIQARWKGNQARKEMDNKEK